MPRNRIIPIFVSHAGCPHQCVFCNQKRIAGQAAPLCAQTVEQAIETAGEAGRGAELAFYGGSFTAIDVKTQELLLGAAQPYLSSGAISAIRLSTRPDAIDRETVERLCRFGVSTVELGSQSMDDAVLLESGRGHTAEDTETAVHLLKDGGISVILQMMTGLPGSSDTSDLRTAQRIAALRPDGVRIYPTVVVRDTPLYDRFVQGCYQPQTTDEAALLCARLFALFAEQGIPVLRMGLQPTEDLSAGAAVAGPYHPAFGELVKSRILYEIAVSLLRQTEETEVTLLVRKDRLSAMIGQHRGNLLKLRQIFPEKHIRITPGNCEEWEIRLQSEEKIDTIT